MAGMMTTYFVLLPFTKGKRGHLMAGQPLEMPNEATARRRARKVAEAGGAALAFKRSGDPSTGEFTEAEILAQCGDIPEEALEAFNS